jgi:hypothetical protein
MKLPRKLLLASGMLAAIGLGAWLVMIRPPASASKPLAPASPAAPVVPDGLPPLTIAENFTRATSQSERLQWVRQPALVAAAMAEFFSTGAGAHEVVAKLEPMAPADTGAQIHQRFGVTMAAGTQRLLCVVKTAGENKVDFKAYARHGSAPWAELINGKTKEAGEMRVFIQKGYYYNFGFKHEVRWQNFTATSPDLENPVELYIGRLDPALKLLEQLDHQRPIRVTVAIRALDDSYLQRQFEITRFLGAGWVMEN